MFGVVGSWGFGLIVHGLGMQGLVSGSVQHLPVANIQDFS